MADVKLLDCTLRDGGYINDWHWGLGSARRIIQSLTRAGTDIVEVGFLRNVDGYDPDVTVCNTIEELNRLLPPESQRGHTIYSGMAMRSNYDISKLSPYDGHGIEIIRITAHDYDIRDGMDFAREVKARGYKLSINPINIMGYADKDLLWIFDQVNAIHPWQFSIVDTFGSMRRRDLERIVSLADHNLAPDIRLGLHLHENMALSFCLAQEFLDRPLLRDKTVDGSLNGMGRTPGNLPIELVADYCNENLNTHYDLDEIMDAIQDHIAPIKGESAWGYSPAYFLSARFNLHRNYAEHYLHKGDLTNRDINHLLAAIAPGKKTAFDAAYADKLYTEYKNRRECFLHPAHLPAGRRHHGGGGYYHGRSSGVFCRRKRPSPPPCTDGASGVRVLLRRAVCVPPHFVLLQFLGRGGPGPQGLRPLFKPLLPGVDAGYALSAGPQCRRPVELLCAGLCGRRCGGYLLLAGHPGSRLLVGC